MNRSLRVRVLLGTILCGCFVLSLLGCGVYLAMRQALRHEFDATLEVQARLAAGMVEQNDKKISLDFDAQQMPEFVSPKGNHYFQVWTSDEKSALHTLARSPSLRDAELPAGTFATGRAGEIALPNEQVGRAFNYVFSAHQDEEGDHTGSERAKRVLIRVAAVPEEMNRTLGLLRWLLPSLCLLAIAVMALLLMRIVSHHFKPVTAMAGKIESLGERDLAKRIEAGSIPAELLPVVEKLNGLLDRLQAAFTREKAFTADVSHELRTPLAGLRATLQVCRSRRREAHEYESAIDECSQIVDRMEGMVQTLLLLARSESGKVPTTLERIDLAETIAQSWQLFAVKAAERELAVALKLPEQCLVETDVEKLRIVLFNLMDNAVCYANTGGHIRINVTQDARTAKIEILNSGSTISLDDIPRLAERFWRGDVSRTDTGAHCGLGLSLATRLAALLHAELVLNTTLGGDFIASLVLRAQQRAAEGTEKLIGNGALH